MSKIYLDHAATTSLDPKVFDAMKPYFNQIFGNPASVHSFGQKALSAVDRARKQVADFLDCRPQEIIFTSGATESNNLALKGVCDAARELLPKKQNPHIVTSAIEHHSILEPCEYLKKRGVEITYLPVNKEGIVNTNSVRTAIKDNTVLVSVMYANNEIGTIQPIREIGKLIQKINRQKTRKHKIIFHTDAVQAAAYLDCNVNRLKVDLLSLSGHKFYGPKGVGVLFIKEGTLIKSIQQGGFQEYGMRAGTLNVPGIVGIGEALEQVVKNQDQIIRKIKKLRDRLIDGILDSIPNTSLNGSRELRLPNNANFCFKNAEGESILLCLDFENIACSTGSACTSGTLEPSHVLTALGISSELAHGSIRFTLGKDNTQAEIDKVLKLLPKIVKRLRKISPIKK